jgi:hypothetical protein
MKMFCYEIENAVAKCSCMQKGDGAVRLIQGISLTGAIKIMINRFKLTQFKRSDILSMLDEEDIPYTRIYDVNNAFRLLCVSGFLEQINDETFRATEYIQPTTRDTNLQDVFHMVVRMCADGYHVPGNTGATDKQRLTNTLKRLETAGLIKCRNDRYYR